MGIGLIWLVFRAANQVIETNGWPETYEGLNRNILNPKSAWISLHWKFKQFCKFSYHSGSRGATPPELSPRHRNDETYQDIQSSALDSEAFYENLPYLRPTGGSPAFHNKKDVPEGLYTSVCSEEEYFSVSDQQRSQQYTPHANPRLTGTV
jgi:hypothetical protein